MIYINAIASKDTLQHNIKELIPNALQRRRMSELVKNGVAVGMECLYNFKGKLDSIITATSLGCLDDSEKFLDNIINNEEDMLSPTPFIQSTFNTIGGQLAILINSHAYNVTYSHRNLSFESALMDSILQLSLNEAENILLGAFDQYTPTSLKLLNRMNIKTSEYSDGVFFFLLSINKNKNSIATINLLETDKINSNINPIFINDNIGICSATILFNLLSTNKTPSTIINSINNNTSIFQINLC